MMIRFKIPVGRAPEPQFPFAAPIRCWCWTWNLGMEKINGAFRYNFCGHKVKV